MDAILLLKSNMDAYHEALAIAEMEQRWQPHPSRREQQIALVGRIEHVWDECDVPLNGCVIRFYNRCQRATDYIVLVTTDMKLTADG